MYDGFGIRIEEYTYKRYKGTYKIIKYINMYNALYSYSSRYYIFQYRSNVVNERSSYYLLYAWSTSKL